MKYLLLISLLTLALITHVQAQKPLVKPTPSPQPNVQDTTAEEVDSETDEGIEEADEQADSELMFNENPDVTEKDITTPDQEKVAEPTKPVEPNQNLQYSSGGDRYQIVPYYKYQEPSVVKKVLKNGTKIYGVKTSPQKYSGGLRMGPYFPSNLRGDVSGVTFSLVYPNVRPTMIGVDLEYQFFRSAGKLGVLGGLGFFTARGNGRFLNNISQQALENFTLITLPVNISLIYRMQFWDKQPLVPFAGGGVDYFAMAESRDDRSLAEGMFSFGGAPAWHWMAGAQLQLDWLDNEVVWQMDNDYGINHVYLTANVRQVVGLNSTFDFSALFYEGGFLFEF